MRYRLLSALGVGAALALGGCGGGGGGGGPAAVPPPAGTATVQGTLAAGAAKAGAAAAAAALPAEVQVALVDESGAVAASDVATTADPHFVLQAATGHDYAMVFKEGPGGRTLGVLETDPATGRSAFALPTGSPGIDLGTVTLNSKQGKASCAAAAALAEPTAPRPDSDGDGVPDMADTSDDEDGDGVPDADDDLAFDDSESEDSDGDGLGQNEDTDDDNDGVADAEDAFPIDPAASVDTDADGKPDAWNAGATPAEIAGSALLVDEDDDDDGFADAEDAFPTDPAQHVDPEVVALAGVVREAAAAAGLGSLADVPVPVPDNLYRFLKPGWEARKAAVRLGKALFWDMQVGSDGQACGSCHFHAGADSRAKNQLNPQAKAGDTLFGNPAVGTVGFPQFGPNYELTATDFPFFQLQDPEEENYLLRVILKDTNDVVSSQGVFNADFLGIEPFVPADLGEPFADPVFNVAGVNVRRVEPRNTPTMINAVFNFMNFWDGRAHNEFNGVSPLGPLDEQAGVWVVENGALVKMQVRLLNSSLASQAVGPVLTDTEMSFFNRPFPEVARKLFTLRPLGLQRVDPSDSVLGRLARPGTTGLATDYVSLIATAFLPEYWESWDLIDGYTQMETNFSLFFGLAVQLYESTLVSDQTPFDRFMAGDDGALTLEQLQGLTVFVNRGARGNFPEVDAAIAAFAAKGVTLGAGNCSSCHGGPELTDASVASVTAEPVEVEETTELVGGLLQLSDATAFVDNGFANIGVRPFGEDLGRGEGPDQGHPFPLSFARQALLNLDFGPVLPLEECSLDGTCPVGDRVSVDGAFKIPGLRNVELTGPYFHTGGEASLGQVVEFYDRQGNFGDVNVALLERNMAFVALADTDEDPLIEFLLALTDERVREAAAPFDHPQLFVPNGHLGSTTVLDCLFGLQACDDLLEIQAVGAGGRTAAGLPPLGSFLGL